jgi:hypothetical protein
MTQSAVDFSDLAGASDPFLHKTHQSWFANSRCFQWGQGQRLPRLVEQLIEYDTAEIQGGVDANPLQQFFVARTVQGQVRRCS